MMGSNNFTEASWVECLKSPFYRESHHKLRKYLREYLEKEIFPHAHKWEQEGEVPAEVHAQFSRRGLAFPSMPRKYRHGKGLLADIPDEEWDLFHGIIVTEELGRCPHMGVIWGLTGGSAIGCPPILNYGTEEQRIQYLPRVFKGELRFCLAVTEPEAGSDVAGIRTAAHLDLSGEYYIVSGQKKWITNGIWADYATTAVRTGGPGADGLSVLLIPLKNTPGVTLRRMAISGLNASGSTFITFADVRVPRANLLGREGAGFKIIAANFNPERLALTAGALRLARTCYAQAYAHALRRRVSGHLLVENQIVRAKLAAMARAVESGHAWMEQIVYHIQQTPRAEEDPAIAARLALVKVHAGKTLEMCCREAQQILGGLGVTKEGLGSIVEQISRDLRVWIVGGGSEEVMDDLGMRLIISQSRKDSSRL